MIDKYFGCDFGSPYVHAFIHTCMHPSHNVKSCIIQFLKSELIGN